MPSTTPLLFFFLLLKLKSILCLLVNDFVFLNIYKILPFLDFHKIGGFDLFPQLLSDEEAEIRWQTLQLIACLVQNNPYCQKAVLENNMLPVLLELLDQDNHSTVKIKALYATSCKYHSPVVTILFFPLNAFTSLLYFKMRGGYIQLFICWT